MPDRPNEKYTIRRQVFKLFGAAFHVYGSQGELVAYCKQKAFKLREDIRLFTDESCSEELFVLSARSILDFSTTYDVTLSDGTSLGSLRRKGMKSSFIRDHWLVFDPAGQEIASIQERGSFMSFLRRVHDAAALLSPQTFDVARTSDGKQIASFRQHFNPFVFRLGVAVLDKDEHIDELVILAAACLIAAIVELVRRAHC